MFQLAHKSAAHRVGPNPSADSSTAEAPNLVFVSTQEVIFNTAVAVPAATAHHHSVVSALLGTISHFHVKLAEAQPIYPRRGANYFEAARMSRLIEHL
jgi:hypothetical protein